MAVHVVTLTCPDRHGIVASIAQGFVELDANIVESAQFGDETSGTFCMRTLVDAPVEEPEQIEKALADRAAALGATIAARRVDRPVRTLVLVSRHDHCLLDLLYRWRAGELAVDIVAVASNHPDLRPLAERDDVPFHHLPVTAERRDEADARLLALLDELSIDLVVLARYMQVLSPTVCAAMPGRMINIHHSFLPGFRGARPYHQAWERGVKVIGATAHYVTEGLDEGPIIDQDTTRVTHAHGPGELQVVGRDLERLVLARAVAAHAEGRVFLLGPRTVVLP
ncbi:MAG TPA: formyltetrahydrofolate deformylase [Iamia sp.]